MHLDMDLKNLKPEAKENILTITVAGILIVVFYILLKNVGWVFNGVLKLVKALAPFIFGFAFAFVLIPLRRTIEIKWLKHVSIKFRTKRKIATLICMLVLILVLFSFFAILIPQLADSLSTFSASFDGYVQKAVQWVESINGTNSQMSNMVNSLIDSASGKLTEWLTGARGGIATLLSFSISFARGILNFLIGVIICIYILLDEEVFKKQFKSLLYAILNKKSATRVIEVLRLTSKTFNSFLFGKFIDSLIIGVITYIAVVIMRMPYAPLIAFVIGITNMIPVFGPFIGAIPCLLILLIIDFWMALEFFVFIVILQQIDGNVIGPRILGDAVGLPTLWVMFAIIVGGSLFGIVGMFVGVPIFSVIYVLANDRIKRNLKEKNIVVED